MSSFKQNLAIFIGINRYSAGIPPLHTAVTDAAAIAEILKDKHGYQVERYLDEDATSKKLNALLQSLELDNSDRLLFYFAGHGIALNGDDGPQGYLIPQDAKLGDVSTYMPMAQVEAALTQLSCRHCLVILDCCFGGAFRWSSTRKAVPIPKIIHKERYDRFIQDPAWQVITSASHDQYALDALDLKDDRGIDRTYTQHSPFAAALMDALEGKADAYPPGKNGQPAGDGVITATELYLYLRDVVEVATDSRNLRQTPGLWSLKKHDKGEYIFLTPDHVLNLPSAPTLDDQEENNPYRGLKAYEREHSALFFGRASLVEKLCDFVCDRSFTVVLGASGSGKSSLVKAGLIPHLEGVEAQQQRDHRLEREVQTHHHKHQQWQILPIMRPGEAPLDAFRKALQDSQLFGAEISKSALTPEVFLQILKDWYNHHPNTRLLLTIDQSEELITQCRSEQEREQFLQLIIVLLQKCSEYVHVVLTLRSDFEPQLSEYAALKSQWVASRFIVPAMTRDELREVIEEPASSKVVYFETSKQRGSLVEQLINEVAAMPGALPLLSFALSELYLKLARRFLDASTTGDIPDRLITWQDYDEVGGVTRSVTDKANKECETLLQKDQAYDQTVRSVMLRMVSIDGGSPTKRKVPLSELEYPDGERDRVKQVVQQFEQARLLTGSRDDEGTPYVEPAHDALILGWHKLKNWIQTAGENLVIQRQLTYAAVSWQRENQSSRSLWHNNPRLSLFAGKHQTDHLLNQLEHNFVRRSIVKRRINNFRNGGILAGIVLLGLGATVFWRSSEINQMRDLQGSAEGRLLQGQNLEALIESIKAGKALKHPLLKLFPPEESVRNEVQATLQNAVSQVRERNRLVTDRKIDHIAFSPDGQRIATVHTPTVHQEGKADEVATVSYWDASGKPLALNSPIPGIEASSIQGISFTSDGRLVPAEDTKYSESDAYQTISSDRTLAASAKAGMLSIYRADPNNGSWQLLATTKIATRFNGELPLHIRFSPDNQRIATAGARDNNIYLWDLAGNQLAQFQHVGGVNDLKFSPDGQQLATVGANGVVRIWQHLEGSQIQESRGYSGQDEIEKIQISADRQQVATGMKSGTVQLWSLTNQAKISEHQFPEQKIAGLRFSPNHRFLAIGSEAGQVLVWNLESWLLTPPVPGPMLECQGTMQKKYLGMALWGVNFSPDSQWLVVGGTDTKIHNSLQLPNENDTVTLPEESREEGDITVGWLQGFAFNQTGQILAAGGFDGRLQLWDWKQTSQIAEQQTGIPIQHIAFNPNGNLIVVTGIDNGIVVAQIWSFNTQSIQNTLQKQAELRGHTQMINAVVFSADGQYLATASEDGTARVWNLQGQHLAVFQGHDAVKDVAFSQDGRQLITAGFSSNIAAPKLESEPLSHAIWQVKTWELQTLDQLLVKGCAWIQSYLKHSQDLKNRPEFQNDRTICDDITSNASTQITPGQLVYLTPVQAFHKVTTVPEPASPASPQVAIEPSPQASVTPATPTFQVVNSDPNCSALGYPNRFAFAETQKYQIYICGKDVPQIYFGMDKRNQDSIRRPLHSYENGIFTAFNNNYMYALTKDKLTITKDNQVIGEEAVQIIH